ncbi:MAG: 2-C-methyl-D-erythritol 2,4-cyclodiphosphate synthase [Bacteroidota bacterium]
MEHLTHRFGIGYDVHRFAAGRKLILGGVRIPSKEGLLGHSDADVLLHAVCDAVLGAAALGDIGRHFPDSSRRYKNISSLKLLKQVAAKIKKRKYVVGNIDATIVLESPKIRPYAARMEKNIARSLGVPADRISVKATTNEGLGFAGRREGCAAVAIACLISLE